MNNNKFDKINITESSDRDLFVPVYLNFLHSHTLTGKEKLIYIILKSFLAVGTDEGKVFPSIKTLCELTDMSNKTITNHLKSMEKKGVLSIERRGLTKSNVYTLYDKKSLWDGEEESEDSVTSTDELEKAKKLLETAGYSVEKKKELVTNQPKEDNEEMKDIPSNFKSQIEYEKLISEDKDDKEIIDTIVNIVHESSQSNDVVKIGKNEINKTVFLSEIHKLNKDMILSIIKKFKEAADVKNPKSYLLSMIYHQPGIHYVEKIGNKPKEKSTDLLDNSSKNSFHNFDQRNYDYDELEAKLNQMRLYKK